MFANLRLPGGRQLVQFFLSRLVVSGNWRLSRTEPAGSPEYSEVFSSRQEMRRVPDRRVPAKQQAPLADSGAVATVALVYQVAPRS